jgi:hypothetical protein
MYIYLTDARVEEIKKGCAAICYNQTKARMFNVLEAHFDEGQKLDAIKLTSEDIIGTIASNIEAYLDRVLIDTEKGG